MAVSKTSATHGEPGPPVWIVGDGIEDWADPGEDFVSPLRRDGGLDDAAWTRRDDAEPVERGDFDFAPLLLACFLRLVIAGVA